jgi:four helix bundle protein
LQNEKWQKLQGACSDMTPEDLSERLWDFAARIGKLVEALPDSRLGRHVAGQLVRCGTSSAPNYDEACAAESRADFIHKISVALKEMRETKGWLKFTIKTRLLPQSRIASLLDESMQLGNILGRSIVTTKAKATRNVAEARTTQLI